MKSPRLAAVLSALLLPLGMSCANLIGLHERPLDKPNSMAGGPNGTGGNTNEVVDKETSITTTKLCVDYCDTILENCPLDGDFKQYFDRKECIDVCNALPEGDTEPTGNTANCRLIKARAAKSTPDEVCRSAGPASDGTCGKTCENWCYFMEQACPEDYALMVDCEQTCLGLKDDRIATLEASFDAPTLQCRTYHLTVALSEPAKHCGHGIYRPTLHCGDVGLPNCETYCSNVMANCPASNDVKEDYAVYDSRSDCLAACSAFEVGTLDEMKANTLGCHYYHATLAYQGRSPHCAHAGPSGEGACMADTEVDGKLVSSENCDSYCRLYKKGCETDFNLKYAGPDECMADCATTFDTKGARASTASVIAPGSNSFYVAKTAPLADTLQCRIYHAVKATAGDATSCALAATDSDCGK